MGAAALAETHVYAGHDGGCAACRDYHQQFHFSYWLLKGVWSQHWPLRG